METPRDKYYMKLFRTTTYFNNRNGTPLSNEKIRYGMHKFVAEEKTEAYNVTVDHFSMTPNTQRENENTIFTSENRYKSDALAETLKGLTINYAVYYESDSANTNDAKGDPASYMKVSTHTTDVKKRKVTDTSN